MWDLIPSGRKYKNPNEIKFKFLLQLERKEKDSSPIKTRPPRLGKSSVLYNFVFCV